MRRALAIFGLSALAWFSASVLPAAAEEGDEPSETLDAPDATTRYGVLIDPKVPALQTFASWPPLELRERLYRLRWSGHAFQRAALFHRPVFFVLTVDWNRASQRLVRETLSDAEVLRTINAGYITVAVNADLRPDIRERYQTGAWPVIAFLLPGGEPVLSQANDVGVAKPITTGAVDEKSLLFLLKEGSVYWTRWSDLLLEVGKTWAAREGPAAPQPGLVDEAASEWVARWLLGNADRVDGGFATSARFFAPAVEEYAGVRETRGMPALRRHSRLTLERLLASPLYDAREGGMHRLAAGPGFEGIQYEKMLEGNVGLVRSLVYSLRGEDSPALREKLVGTIGFLTTVLGRPEGGFYLAQGADPSSADGGGYWRAEIKGEATPPVDLIVLSGPNAAAGAALVRAGLMLDDDAIVKLGLTALDLVHEKAYASRRGVRHAIVPAGDPGVYLTAQADVALGFADAFESTGDRRYLSAAKDLVDFVLANLSDPGESALRDHLPQARPIGLLQNERRPLRPNVRVARAMLRLDYHGLGSRYREEAVKILSTFSGDLSSYGIQGTETALAIEEVVTDPLTITVSGPASSAATKALRRAAVNSPWPWTIVLTGQEGSSGEPAVEIRWKDVRKVVTEPEAVHEAIHEITGGTS